KKKKKKRNSPMNPKKEIRDDRKRTFQEMKGEESAQKRPKKSERDSNDDTDSDNSSDSNNDDTNDDSDSDNDRQKLEKKTSSSINLFQFFFFFFIRPFKKKKKKSSKYAKLVQASNANNRKDTTEKENSPNIHNHLEGKQRKTINENENENKNDENEKNENKKNDNHRPSKLTAQLRRSKRLSKRRVNQQHDEKKHRRNQFTPEENNALLAGLAKYKQFHNSCGKGMYYYMKSDPHLGPILKNRSNVQLKDRVRCLRKYKDSRLFAIFPEWKDDCCLVTHDTKSDEENST
ncbi:hypothetical protein RFI_07181, partial [Reticulomyxa filosa]